MRYKKNNIKNEFLFHTARTSYFSPMIKQRLYPSRAVHRKLSLSSWEPKIKHSKNKIKLCPVNQNELQLDQVAKCTKGVNIPGDRVFQHKGRNIVPHIQQLNQKKKVCH